MKAPIRALIFAFSILILAPLPAHAFGIYTDFGFGIGTLKNGANYFNQPTADGSHSSTVINGGLYYPVLEKALILDLGLMDRLTYSSTSSGSSLGMNTVNVGARLEFARFFVGAGYGVFDMVSSAGSSSPHAYSGVHSHFFEGGVIWRVIPEFYITLSAGLEYASPTGGTSPSPSSDYGIHFRFPLYPSERPKSGSKSVEFDGFRYPFGFMK